MKSINLAVRKKFKLFAHYNIHTNMKQSILFFSILLLTSTSAFSQVSQLGEPLTFKDKVVKTSNYFLTPSVDNASEIQAEQERQAQSGDKMTRFGKEHPVSIDVFTEGEKTVLPNGDLLYQFGIECKNAVSINLIFDKFQLANGVRLYLSDPVKKKYDGAYTSLNNNTPKMLGTEIVYTDKLIIEIQVPHDKDGQSILHLGTIVHGFRNLDNLMKALNSSGDCEYDVNCPLGQGWESQRNAVAMMVNGGGFCSGSLVNNTSGTIIPYFLSANHCGTTPGSWVFRFRWESPEGQADCATSAPSIDGPSTMNVNGGTLCANYTPSDFTLTLLNTPPDPTWGIYYNGWDRTEIPATQLTGIHHPAADIKKISRDNSTAVSASFNGGAANTHWTVPSWDEGVTEGGSSGSPLFNQHHRTIGQLHGGTSACGAAPQDLNDQYGKFAVSWDGGATNNTRLSNWLDPGNIGPWFIDGVDPAAPTVSNDAEVSNAKVNFGTLCGGTLTPQVDLYNSGTTTLTSATIHYGYDGLTDQTYTWSGSLVSYGTSTITLPNSTLPGGSHTFKAIVISDVNNTVATNDTTGVNFTTVTNGAIINVSLNINCYANEDSWVITDTLSQTTFASGGGYDGNNPLHIIDSVCLAIGCYKFTMTDAYGDGILGDSTSACYAGSYYISTAQNDTIAALLPINSNFGTTTFSQFCLGDAGLEEYFLKQQISIFPNPATSDFTISSKDVAIEKIEIMTITGQKIYENNPISESTTIDSSSFAKGMYFVQMHTQKGIVLKSLVIR